LSFIMASETVQIEIPKPPERAISACRYRQIHGLS